MSIMDVIGPVMVGPSSSHTAGACRIGLLAGRLFGKRWLRADISLHGSFAATGIGHGTQYAVLAGLLGCCPDDERIPRAMDLASQNGLDFKFSVADLGNVHPNSVRIGLKSGNDTLSLCASSVGGGRIRVWMVDGFAVDLDGERPTLLVSYPDRKGIIAAISAIISEAQVSIGEMKVHRNDLDGTAMMTVALDQDPPPSILDSISELRHIDMARLVSDLSLGV